MDGDIYGVSRSPTPELRRSPTSSDKHGVTFELLPKEIIHQILSICDPNSFASLVLLNRHWRSVSQQRYLYALQLSKCGETSATHSISTLEWGQQSLSQLQLAFSKQIKRNLFETYLRPRETVIRLVSTTTSSSAAFPGGEAFHFSFSANGHHVLAYSSSRIYVLDLTTETVAVRRELKILRRPASVAILDDGSFLAVLSTDHQLDLYDLKEYPPRHVRALALDHPPRTIALSPDGSVLAAAFDGGVEVYSLLTTALVTDRRAVKCDAVDSLSFSADGTQLLGTTSHSKNPSTVVLTAPYYDPGEALPEDNISHLWTTSILFPNSSRDCSHAILLPSRPFDEASWTFTYDRVFETFRAVRIDDLRNGTTYFTGPTGDSSGITRLLPSALPSCSGAGDLVAAVFKGQEIWVYAVPKNLDVVLDHQSIAGDAELESSNQLTRMSSSASNRSHTWPRDTTSSRMPQWQTLVDKSRNMFVQGHKIGTSDGITALKWVAKSREATSFERLVAAAPGVIGRQTESDDDSILPVDGGRITIFDFEHSVSNGRTRFLTIEVGELLPEVLEEEHRDMDAEIAMVRRRTVAQKKDDRTAMLRSATVSAVTRSPDRTMSTIAASSLRPRRTSSTSRRSDIGSVDEDAGTFDAPYAHGSPRSGDTMRRAATAAANNRRLNPPRVTAREHVQYRRADGREEHPHESDADNWVPPPPPYTRDPIPTLPEHLRKAVMITTSPIGQEKLNRLHQPGIGEHADAVVAAQTSPMAITHSQDYFSQRAPPETLVHDTITDNNDNSFSRRSSESFDADSNVSATHYLNSNAVYDVSPPGTPQLASSDSGDVVITGDPSPPRASRADSGHGAEPVVEPKTSAQLPMQIPRRPVPAQSSQPPTESNQTAALEKSVNLEPKPMEASPVIAHDGEENARMENMGRTSQNSSRVGPDASNGLKSRQIMPISRLDEPIPTRPDNEYRLTEPGPSTPTVTAMPEESFQPRQRQEGPYGDASLADPEPTPNVSQSASIDFGMPSAAQLARLNSRSGRPPSRVLTEPSRRSSGTFGQPQFAIRPASQQSSRRGSVSNTQGTPRAQRKSLIIQEEGAGNYASGAPRRNNSGRISKGPQRHGQSTPNLRPRPSRLETIASVASYGETTSTEMQTNDMDDFGAAKRSQASRRGWMGSMKARKDAMAQQEQQQQQWQPDPTPAMPMPPSGRSEEVLKERKQSRRTKCTVM